MTGLVTVCTCQVGSKGDCASGLRARWMYFASWHLVNCPGFLHVPSGASSHRHPWDLTKWWQPCCWARGYTAEWAGDLQGLFCRRTECKQGTGSVCFGEAPGIPKGSAPHHWSCFLHWVFSNSSLLLQCQEQSSVKRLSIQLKTSAPCFQCCCLTTCETLAAGAYLQEGSFPAKTPSTREMSLSWEELH